MIEYAQTFLKEAKQLSKKFKHLKADLAEAIDEIESKHDVGISLGYNLFKKRVRNSSIPTGKSGGFRIIIYQQIQERTVLISIYSKTERESISDAELIERVKIIMEEQ